MLTKPGSFRPIIVALIWVSLWYSNASGHGGIAGPDELGPPVITATVLGIVGYWTVMLWPSRRNTGRRSKTLKRGQARPSRRMKERY